MTATEWLIEQHIAKAGKLSHKDFHEARKREIQLIKDTFADALVQVGITIPSAKRIAADYYTKKYDT